MQNFCHNCGMEIQQKSNFCPSCGAKLTQENAEKSAKVKKEQPAKNVKSNSHFLILFAVIFAAVVIYLVLNSNKKPANVSQNTNAMPEAQSGQLNSMMQAVFELKKALEADPDNYDLNVQMANNYFDIGRFNEAITHYKKALRIKREDPSIIIDAGVAFFNLGQMDSALTYMKGALKMAPDHPQGLYNVGIVYFNQGDTSKAVQYWSKLVEQGGDSPQVKTAQKFIEQLKINI